MKPILGHLVLLLSIFAHYNQMVTGNTPNFAHSTSTKDPSMDTSTTSLFTRVFQMLIKTMLMVFGVAFSVILALLLIGLMFLTIHKIRIYWQFREFQIAERRRRYESLEHILMRDF